MTFVQMYVGSD